MQDPGFFAITVAARLPAHHPSSCKTIRISLDLAHYAFNAILSSTAAGFWHSAQMESPWRKQSSAARTFIWWPGVSQGSNNTPGTGL
jgi:hypothetical protein